MMIDGTYDDRIMELAYRAMGFSAEQAEAAIEDNNVDIDQAVFNKYECDFYTYCNIVNDLLKFTPLCMSPLSGTIFHAFVDVSESRAILKLPVDDETQEKERNRLKQLEDKADH